MSDHGRERVEEAARLCDKNDRKPAVDRPTPPRAKRRNVSQQIYRQRRREEAGQKCSTDPIPGLTPSARTSMRELSDILGKCRADHARCRIKIQTLIGNRGRSFVMQRSSVLSRCMTLPAQRRITGGTPSLRDGYRPARPTPGFRESERVTQKDAGQSACHRSRGLKTPDIGPTDLVVERYGNFTDFGIRERRGQESAAGSSAAGSRDGVSLHHFRQFRSAEGVGHCSESLGGR